MVRVPAQLPAPPFKYPQTGEHRMLSRWFRWVTWFHKVGYSPLQAMSAEPRLSF